MEHLPQHVDAGTRNFYEDLFSPDTSSSISNSTSSNIDIVTQHEPPNIEFSNLDTLKFNKPEDNSYSSSSDMDISSGGSCSSYSTSVSEISDRSLQPLIPTSKSHSDHLEESALPPSAPINGEMPVETENCNISPVITYLEEEEIADLFGENVSLPEPECRETLEKENIDIIASFNVRNKYEHSMAAELLLKEKLTFLAIQEPYASSHKASESWKAYQKLELDSARISCYETPYQMILFDSWKWGCRIISPFESLQYGRVASIGFDLGNSLQIGIISIYATTKRIVSDDASEESTHPSMKISARLVQKILSKWKIQYPDMTTIILGDFQETLSISDKDNLGAFRQDLTRDGIIAGLQDSHESIVRKRNPNISYVTRFGEQGARGIDHIFFPTDNKFSDICVDAKIQRSVGANYFPSDHSLLTCSISRKSQNNNCGGREKTKFDYSKIFSIKMSQSGKLGQDIGFNFSQFKNCAKFKEQLKLFKQLQEKTGDESIMTNAYLPEIEDRIEQLFNNLWKNGEVQEVDGSKNKLVKIAESQAAELSYILNSFNSAIKTVMTEFKLFQDNNSNDSAGATRGRLMKRNGFKIFNNLPVPTKLRYVQKEVEAKLNQVVKNIYWLKEFDIRNKHEIAEKSSMTQEEFWTQWSIILKSDTLRRKAEAAATAYTEESTERSLHTSAIQHECSKKDGSNKRQKNQKDAKSADGNSLPNVSDNVTKLLNFWLSNSGCNQGFNANANKGTSSAFLSQKINDWKEHLTSMDIKSVDLSIPHQSKLIMENLVKSQIELQKFSKQISKLQHFYRTTTLDYFLDTSNVASFTRKVIHKSRQAPAAHTSIWDSSIQEFRTCKDELEELQATSAFHGHWMANSKAHEICAFAKIRKQGRLGNRGISLHPNRVVTLEDIPFLIHKGAFLPRKIKKDFVRAHGHHTARLFKEPEEDNPEFFYPFYLRDTKGGMQNGEELERSLWKAISSSPTKARFEGFQLAVVGRFGARWRKLLLNIIKLILVMRYVPTALKKMARFPIPKPGKHNEYRPISLCHDMYCFVMGIITTYSSAAIERAGILHEGLTAYQKGKGCANLVTTELSFREDCLENHVPSAQIDEDEEKFFDRIPVEILLAAMRVNGFPNQGYIEIKASAMEAKTVEIITAKGVTYARFICGLEQGNPDSPTISNLVIKFKHDVWNSISRDIETILQKDNFQNHGKYKFNTVDPNDGQILLCKIGYSDDNSKFISVANEDDIITLVKYFTQLSGDISMVTKIGRKSAKCEVQFYNISASLAMRMEKVWSTAWSFLDDSPIQEQIPFKIHLKQPELLKFYDLSDFFNLEEEAQERWNKIIHAPAHRHLGLSSTLGADTTAAWRKNLEKMNEKVAILKLHRMHLKAQRKCFNMLVGTIPSFVPLQTNFPNEELLKFDQHIAKVCMKSNGLSKSDTKTRMFLPIQHGGLGLISTLELDLIAVAREFEIVGNNMTLDSRSFRTRITALTNYPIHSIYINQNHAREAISKLAGYGIYVRDSCDGILNDIMAEISITYRSYKSFNHPQYRDNCKMGIGLGKNKNKQLMLGGPVHSILHMLQNNNWKSSDFITSIAKSYNISPQSLLRIRSKIKKEKQFKSKKFFNFWEWRNTSLTITNQISTEIDNWTMVKSDLESENDIRPQEANHYDHYRIVWDKFVRLNKETNSIIYNPYAWEGRLLKFIMHSNSPILIATDGAHSPTETGSSAESAATTSSSFVLCVADIKENESLNSGQWMNRPVIPLLSRASILPQNLGSSSTDIAHGEFGAMLMAEIAFLNLPRITLTDSKAIRQQVLNIRNLRSVVNDRHYIRSIAGGVGKYMSGLLRYLLHGANPSAEHKTLIFSPAMKKINEALLERNKLFLNIAKSWISPVPRDNEGKLVGWEEQYFDDNVRNPLLKINSHQLDKTGTRIKETARYKNLIPNLAVLSANHHADVCADLVKGFPHEKVKWNRPPTYLRFYLTCGGLNIDRNISDFCHDQFSVLKIRKLRLKKTQGLLWRILHFTSTTWEILQLYKGWLRSLLGLSSTHTRRTYKSEIYRECCKSVLIQQANTDSQIQNICAATPSQASKLYGQCLWCEDSTKCTHKGNRNHAILYCSNKKISSFRIRLTNLIEAKLKLFFLDLGKATNFENVENGIRIIERTFLEMQNDQTGRLTRLPESSNNRYSTIEETLRRGNCTSIELATTTSTFNFFSELFGLTPFINGSEITDESLGIVDCPWLGLTPKYIDDVMLNLCLSTKKFISHNVTAENLHIYLQHSWSEIKTLIMGKAIGIHRIIGSTGKQAESDWKKEFNIDTNSIKRIKQEMKSDQAGHSPLFKFTRVKRKFDDNSIHLQMNCKKHKATVVSPETFPMKICIGITCSKKFKSWYSNNNFLPNKTRTSIKQCQRCSRFMTGLRQCQIIFSDLEKCSNPTAIQDVLTFIRLHHNYMKHKYHSLFNKMNECLPVASKIELEKTKRVSDRFKLIGNITCITVLKSTNHFTIQDDKVLCRSSNLLSHTISRKNLDFILDKEAEVKIQILNHNNADSSGRNFNTESSSFSTPQNSSESKIDLNTYQQSIEPEKSPIPSTILLPSDSSQIRKLEIQEQHTPNKQVIVQNVTLMTQTNKLKEDVSKLDLDIHQQKIELKEPPIPSPILPSSNSSRNRKSEGQIIMPVKHYDHKFSINSKSQSKQQSPNKQISVQNVELMTRTKKLKDYASRIIRPNVCMEGGNMTKAIEILRSYKTSNTFFASAESENLIMNWQLHQGWKQFAKIFGSRELLDNKINATYLIPLFSGDTSCGHWHLCVIQKLGRRDYKGWCIDSLGTGRVEDNIAHKIQHAFKPGRGRFVWIPCTCKRQEELECGPRTILAMWRIQKKLHDRKPLDEGIQSATLIQEPDHLFTATKIRERIANFINTFRSNMITAPIRFRQRTSLYRAPTNNAASKNPIWLE